MKVSRAIFLWLLIIVALVLLLVAQLLGVFRLGFASILGDVLAFVFALLLVTILALVGAVFVGIFIAHRILSPQGFSPFEEEMLKMRQEVQDLHRKLDHISAPADDGKDRPSSASPEGSRSTEEGKGGPP